jgi:hypothetical protein
VLVLLSGLLLGASGALAKNMQGKAGLGFQQTMPGARGLSLAYWTSDQMAVQLLLGAEFLVAQGGNSSNRLHYGLGFKYVLVATRFANLSIGARISGAFASEQTFDGQDASGTPTSVTASNLIHLAAEIPFEIEYFFSDAFALNLAFGFMATRVPDQGALLQPTGLGATSSGGSTGIGIGSGGLLGAAGFTFYL